VVPRSWQHPGPMLLANDRQRKGKGKGKLTLQCPPALLELLRDHRKGQAADRLRAGTSWTDHDLVFATQPRQPHRTHRGLASLEGHREAPDRVRAGSPMSRRRPPPIEEQEKPLGEMTPAERAAYLAQVRRTLREDEIRRGARPPRSLREFEIWREAQAEKDERAATRTARLERRQQRARIAGLGRTLGAEMLIPSPTTSHALRSRAAPPSPHTGPQHSPGDRNRAGARLHGFRATPP
jgi:hypothetical protein